MLLQILENSTPCEIFCEKLWKICEKCGPKYFLYIGVGDVSLTLFFSMFHFDPPPPPPWNIRKPLVFWRFQRYQKGTLGRKGLKVKNRSEWKIEFLGFSLIRWPPIVNLERQKTTYIVLKNLVWILFTSFWNRKSLTISC